MNNRRPITSTKDRLSGYLPGIILFFIAVVVCIFVYQDYGMAWDEPGQRFFGVVTYDYLFNGSQEMLSKGIDHHGSGFELILVFLEKQMRITDSRDIYLMRHLVCHLFFLVSCFFGYVLAYRLFRNKFIASLGFIILVLAPRIYAHSYFNSKDIPFLSVILIALAICQYAFEKNKLVLFLIAGLLCGFATSIRITGVILLPLIIAFLLFDLLITITKKEKPLRAILRLLLFPIGFCLSLYAWWPYLWPSPVSNFMESYHAMAHFNWGGNLLFHGKIVNSGSLPWTYFPIWFSISTPLLWLALGVIGIIWIVIDFFQQPSLFLQNTRERNFLLFLLCFFGPVLAVILLHSVLYDDWRHLYFVYPAFVLLALYAINKVWQTRLRWLIATLCVVQIGLTGWFMARNHPFQDVYFNELTSHKNESLSKNYELDYWGCSFKQGLEYIVANDARQKIRIAWTLDPLPNNIMMLQERDRNRIEIVDIDPDYRITNYRAVPFGYYDKLHMVYSVRVLNSTILGVYKLK